MSSRTPATSRRAGPGRPRKDTRNPCAVCGWGPHMAIHQPIVSGPRKGEPWGHAYQPMPATPGSHQHDA